MSSAYLVTYDLCKPGRNYAALIDLLATQWGGKKIAESVWFVELVCDAGKARDIIQTRLDGNDRLAVIELKPGSDWASFNGYPGGVQWLSNHITPAKKAA